MNATTRILVAEHNPQLRSLFSGVLCAADVQVREARTGRQALQVVRRERPDLAVLAARLPGLSGMEVGRRIKADEALRDVVVVLVSGRGADSARAVNNLDSGADEHIATPVTAEEFLARIRLILRLREATVTRRTREQQHRRLIEILPDAVGLADARGRLLAVNPHGVAMGGFRNEAELLGKSILDLTAREDRKRLGTDLARALRTGLPRTAEYTMFRRDGQRYQVEMSLAAWRNAAGRPAGLVGIVRDITGRKRMQQRLADALALNQTVLAASAVGILVCRSSGKCVFANDAVALIAGANVEQVLRLNYRRLSAWQTCGLRQMADRTLRRGGPLTGEFHTISTFGKEVWLHCQTARIFLGGEAHLLLLTTEVTERKRAEAAARMFSRRLWQAQDEERRRIARELHDSLGQKLAAVTMRLDLLRDQAAQAADPDLGIRKRIDDSAALLAECSREARTLSYLLHPPFLEEFGLIVALRAYCERLSARGGLRVTLDAGEAARRLPAEAELALFRVVQEALSNVHRHSGRRRARVRLTHRPDQVLLEISDRGRGIPAAQFKNLRQGIAAPGLGLVGMHERLRQLKGWVEVRSGRRGTKIRAILPLPMDAFPPTRIETPLTRKRIASAGAAPAA